MIQYIGYSSGEYWHLCSLIHIKDFLWDTVAIFLSVLNCFYTIADNENLIKHKEFLFFLFLRNVSLTR